MTPPVWILRLLGIRMLIQGLAEIAAPRRRTFQICAAIDVAHAMSMVGAARIWPAYRRAALQSAAAAGVSALLGAVAASSVTPSK
jgi:hypothetical protein